MRKYLIITTASVAAYIGFYIIFRISGGYYIKPGNDFGGRTEFIPYGNRPLIVAFRPIEICDRAIFGNLYNEKIDDVFIENIIPGGRLFDHRIDGDDYYMSVFTKDSQGEVKKFFSSKYKDYECNGWHMMSNGNPPTDINIFYGKRNLNQNGMIVVHATASSIHEYNANYQFHMNRIIFKNNKPVQQGDVPDPLSPSR